MATPIECKDEQPETVAPDYRAIAKSILKKFKKNEPIVPRHYFHISEEYLKKIIKGYEPLKSFVDRTVDVTFDMSVSKFKEIATAMLSDKRLIVSEYVKVLMGALVMDASGPYLKLINELSTRQVPIEATTSIEKVEDYIRGLLMEIETWFKKLDAGVDMDVVSGILDNITQIGRAHIEGAQNLFDKKMVGSLIMSNLTREHEITTLRQFAPECTSLLHTLLQQIVHETFIHYNEYAHQLSGTKIDELKLYIRAKMYTYISGTINNTNGKPLDEYLRCLTVFGMTIGNLKEEMFNGIPNTEMLLRTITVTCKHQFDSNLHRSIMPLYMELSNDLSSDEKSAAIGKIISEESKKTINDQIRSKRNATQGEPKNQDEKDPDEKK